MARMVVLRPLRRLLPRTVAARLFALGSLALVAVSALGLSSLYFASVTVDAARNLFDRGMIAVVNASDLELLLEKHRRLIESAPVELDRAQIEADRRAAEQVVVAIEGILDTKGSPIEDGIRVRLPALVEKGRRVLDLAANFAQSEALDAVEVYSQTARALQTDLKALKGERLGDADLGVLELSTSSQSLMRWVAFLTLVSLVLIGPFNMTIVQFIAKRLRAITTAMLRLARQETDIAVAHVADEDEIGDMARAVAVFKDNAIALQAKSESLERLNLWFDIALNNMSRGLSMFDGEQRLLVCNARYREMYGLSEDQTRPGTHLRDILDAWTCGESGRRRGDGAAAAATWIENHIAGIAEGIAQSTMRDLPDGRVVMVTYQPLRQGGWVDVHEDVTEKRAAEERIVRLARFDTLTELHNRHSFKEQLETDFNLLRGKSMGSFALLWIDLDRFKEVNDTLGHPVGDALLQEIARRLKANSRRRDLVARLGGDEFAVIAYGEPGTADMQVLADRLIARLSEPMLALGHKVQVGASIGIALAPIHGETPDELIKCADVALYRAKADGRGVSVVFRAELERQLVERRNLAADLRQAIAEGALQLYYQPLIRLADGTISGFEALMRWPHPVRGMISPAVFIPLAEECGLILEMGAWALRRACHEAASWACDAKVAVNLSAVQFDEQDLPTLVAEALAVSGLAARRLELEVTETLLLKDDAETSAMLLKLRDLGVGIALDDFGTGYSSLSYLRRFPFDKIKIDQTFVRDLPQREDCMAIVHAVTALGRRLGMVTVAEGVETHEHLDRLREAGCDEVQGYLFSRPIPAKDVPALIAGWTSAARQAA